MRIKKGVYIAAAVFMFITIAFAVYNAIKAFMDPNSVLSSLSIVSSDGLNIEAYINLAWIAELIPLLWQVPMFIHILLSIQRETACGTGFCVVTLLFGNLITGILLLVGRE